MACCTDDGMTAPCPQCGLEPPEEASATNCGRCGTTVAVAPPLVEAGEASRTDFLVKWRGNTSSQTAQDPGNLSPSGHRPSSMLGRFGHVDADEAIVFVALRGVLLLLLAWWGHRFQELYQPWGVQGHHFIHNTHIIFHEAGHILFMPFGQFMTVAGGSLLQLIVPFAVILALLFRPEKPDPFGAAIGLWWLGTSVIDLSPYIGDAQDLKLIMLGGFVAEDVADAHDWRNILWDLNLLGLDREIATVAHQAGNFLMALGLIWGGWMLLRQARTALDNDKL